MRGKIKACDNCRIKKVKCEGTKPCKRCQSRSIDCIYSHVPKKIKPYGKKNKEIAIVKRNNEFKSDKNDIDARLTKIESLLEVFLKKMNTQKEEEGEESNDSDTYSNSSTESEEFLNEEDIMNINFENKIENRDYLNEKTLAIRNDFTCNSTFQKYDRIVTGDHFSVSTFASKGLEFAADNIKDPFILFPVKNLISNFIRMERSLLSVWTDPVDSARLVVLPPREMIYTVINSFSNICMFDLPFIWDVTEIVERYCDSRDGLIPKQNFSYGELLFLNSCILIGCAVYYEKTKVGIASNPSIPSEKFKMYEKLMLDNTLYYFHRVSIMDDGLSSIKGLTVLCIYSDFYSFTSTTYSMTSYMIRRAQELKLHTAEYYIGNNQAQKYLDLWWVCFYFDKFSALKSGKPPILDNDTITAPALPYLNEYSDNFREYGPSAGLRRTEFHEQIAKKNSLILLEQAGIQKFYFLMEVDYAIIISKLCLYPLKSPRSLDEVTSLLNDLESWRLCFPESLRPDCYKANYTELNDFSNDAICSYFIVADLNLSYHYLKMTLMLLNITNITSSEQIEYKREGLLSAKKLLSLSMDVGFAVPKVEGFSLFYTFSAFLVLNAACIENPTKDGIVDDVEYLTRCAKRLFSSFNKANNSPEKWILLNAASKCILYITTQVVLENNEHISLHNNNLLDQILEIQNTKNFRHLSSFFSKRIKNESENSTCISDRLSEIPVSYFSGNDASTNFSPENDQRLDTLINADHSKTASSSSTTSSPTPIGFENFWDLSKDGTFIKDDINSKILSPNFFSNTELSTTNIGTTLMNMNEIFNAYDL